MRLTLAEDVTTPLVDLDTVPEYVREVIEIARQFEATTIRLWVDDTLATVERARLFAALISLARTCIAPDLAIAGIDRGTRRWFGDLPEIWEQAVFEEAVVRDCRRAGRC